MAEDWTAGWQVHDADRHAAAQRLTPLQRLEWLEQTVTLLAEAGLLDRDRAARQRAADGWGPPPDR